MRTTTLILAAAVMQLLGPRPAFVRTAYAEAPETTIEELVMYGVDADTYELLRYTFNTDEYVRIGKVVDENGNVVEDMECLAQIPSGPHKGFYGASNFYEAQPSQVVKIDGLDASATWLPQTVGFGKIDGMVSVQDLVTGEWVLLASTRYSVEVDNDEDYPDDDGPCLVAIDLVTGRGTPISIGIEHYRGLAINPAGDLYGLSKDGDLWTCQPNPFDVQDQTENKLGSTGFDKIEALEWAYGDGVDAIDAAAFGVPAGWTDNGALFGFDDDTDSLLILNPSNGDSQKIPCAFQTIDCEGMVFTTLFRDSHGVIVADACD
ncbi:MAG: hypothetical protein ACYTE6_15965 [Planctomycetota bacterium]|jgi:hypothetical protein